ncbi:hypothetical protein CKF54_07355 [Psittacicella hinzii]|uniref:Antitoxin SocA-like Panacea domain-containing protein n=1 Tax=Psittacicella hinzii TaxID=2028575 RepID=A0A3A1Y552_9GAMM|nr:hypothetical protein [Psittacicella hinzii]RIY31154.1 hypothetical protein CKF54_07355 [Psittacicella hinzii]
MVKKYVFDDVDILATYLYSLKKEISPIQLQKALYFLYTFYIGMYYNSSEVKELEGGVEFPNELFEAHFEAWTYGPAIRSIYDKRRLGSDFYLNNLESKEYKTFIAELENEPYGKTVLKFVDELFRDILARSEFSLVERSQQDSTWKKAYVSEDKLMSNQSIIEEYLKIFRS